MNYHPNLSAEQKQLLQMVPLQARVKVTQPSGKTRYVAVNQVTPSDQIEVKSDGTPVIMNGLPGRPGKNPVVIPIAQQGSVGFQQHQAKHQTVSRSSLVRLSSINPDSKAVGDALVQELVSELEGLKFDRRALEQKGDVEGASKIADKRIKALMAASTLYLKRIEANISGGMLDLDSPSAQALVLFLVETFRDAMEATGVPNTSVDGVLAKLSRMMDANWKQEAEARIQASVG